MTDRMTAPCEWREHVSSHTNSVFDSNGAKNYGQCSVHQISAIN